jgi:hypothetical protein
VEELRILSLVLTYFSKLLSKMIGAGVPYVAMSGAGTAIFSTTTTEESFLASIYAAANPKFTAGVPTGTDTISFATAAIVGSDTVNADTIIGTRLSTQPWNEVTATPDESATANIVQETNLFSATTCENFMPEGSTESTLTVQMATASQGSTSAMPQTTFSESFSILSRSDSLTSPTTIYAMQ